MSVKLSKSDYGCMLLSYFPGIGPHMFESLIEALGDPNQLFCAPEKILSEIVGRCISDFLIFRNSFNTDKIRADLEKLGIVYIARTNNHYPKQLLTIPDPPIGLFCKGNPNMWKDVSYCGIVGSRTPTSYGIRATTDTSRILAHSGIGVVSGMALGIDTYAHRSALLNDGKTVAVLGCGVDVVYPRENRGLYEQIIEKGAVISEFPPGMIAKKGLFVARNRIIAGMSKAVICVEGHEHSGALITARYAASQGREVCAFPGTVYNRFSQAPNILLREGAFLLTKPEDILDLFDKRVLKLEPSMRQFSSEERQIIDMLEAGGTVDSVISRSGLSFSAVSSVLSSLELEGVISKDELGQWIYTHNHL